MTALCSAAQWERLNTPVTIQRVTGFRLLYTQASSTYTVVKYVKGNYVDERGPFAHGEEAVAAQNEWMMSDAISEAQIREWDYTPRAYWASLRADHRASQDAFEESFLRTVPSTFDASSRSGFNRASNEAAFAYRPMSIVDAGRYDHRAVRIGLKLMTQAQFALDYA